MRLSNALVLAEDGNAMFPDIAGSMNEDKISKAGNIARNLLALRVK